MAMHTTAQQSDFQRRWPLARIFSMLLILLSMVLVIVFFWFGGLFAPEETTPSPELLKELEAYDKGRSITRNIVIKGRDEQGRPYLITASRSLRDETRKNVTRLFDVAGKLEDGKGTAILFRANHADVHRKTDEVLLVGEVVIRKTNSWRLQAPEVRVNRKTRDMTSDHPVVVHMNGTTIRAKGIVVKNQGDVVRFKGPVHARFNVKTPNENGGTAEAETTDAPGEPQP